MYGKGLSSLAVSLLGPKNLILELQVFVAYNVVLGIVVLVVVNTLHSTSLGSGSHFPFPTHVAELYRSGHNESSGVIEHDALSL